MVCRRGLGPWVQTWARTWRAHRRPNSRRSLARTALLPDHQGHGPESRGVLVPFQVVRATPFDDAFLSSVPAVGPAFALNNCNGTSLARYIFHAQRLRRC